MLFGTGKVEKFSTKNFFFFFSAGWKIQLGEKVLDSYQEFRR
jgi:hypothetical protein